MPQQLPVEIPQGKRAQTKRCRRGLRTQEYRHDLTLGEGRVSAGHFESPKVVCALSDIGRRALHRVGENTQGGTSFEGGRGSENKE